MPRENKNQYPILGFLSKQDMSGYDLIKLSRRIGKYFWSDGNAQIYNTLKKLEEQGLVSSQIDKNSGARNRRVYSISKKGLDFYRAWLERRADCVVYRDELLLKMSNAQFLSKKQLLQHLQDEYLCIEVQLSELSTIQAHISNDHAGRKDQPYLLAVYGYIQTSLENKLDWLKKSLRQFK